MSTAQTNSEGGGEAERVRCLYCGANNFPASATCWQCGRPLKAVPAGASTMSSAPAAAYGALTGSVPAPRLAFTPDSALAPKAAAALGLMFPYVGLPVGIVFLMLDDPRKTQLGWMLIGWSVLGTVLNGIALLVTLVPLWGLLKGMAHPGGGVPNGIPGVPNTGGEGEGLFFFGLLAARFLLVYV